MGRKNPETVVRKKKLPDGKNSLEEPAYRRMPILCLLIGRLAQRIKGSPAAFMLNVDEDVQYFTNACKDAANYLSISVLLLPPQFIECPTVFIGPFSEVTRRQYHSVHCNVLQSSFCFAFSERVPVHGIGSEVTSIGASLVEPNRR